MNTAGKIATLVLIADSCAACDPAQPETVTPQIQTGEAPGNLPTRLPNIVILFADDLGYGDLGSYGHPYIRTPNLDLLAAQGQRWTDFYAAAPVCSPSRGALMTGRLPMRTGLYGQRINVLFPNDTVGIPDAEVTIAEMLRERGYRTGIIGKWHLGDAPDTYPTRHGFDYWYGLPYSNDMDWADGLSFEETVRASIAGETAVLEAQRAKRMAQYFEPQVEYWNVPLIRSSRSDTGYTDQVIEQPVDQRTLTHRYTREAQQFIETAADTPFLLYVPYSMPHTPLFRSEQFAGVSAGQRYGDVIEELDWSVGAIRDTLEQQGLAENTLVLFTSDNGPWLYMRHHGGSAGPLANGKGTTFEGGMRVPAIFWWPGQIEPGIVSDPGSMLDLFATAAQLSGATSDPGPDSLDLSPTLLQGEPSPRNSISYYRGGELQAYRSGPWKLRFISAGAYGMPPERIEHEAPALFYLLEDPGERFDVADAHPEVVAELLAEVELHQQRLEIKPPLFDQRLQTLLAEPK